MLWTLFTTLVVAITAAAPSFSSQALPGRICVEALSNRTESEKATEILTALVDTIERSGIERADVLSWLEGIPTPTGFFDLLRLRVSGLPYIGVLKELGFESLSTDEIQDILGEWVEGIRDKEEASAQVVDRTEKVYVFEPTSFNEFQSYWYMVVARWLTGFTSAGRFDGDLESTHSGELGEERVTVFKGGVHIRDMDGGGEEIFELDGRPVGQPFIRLEEGIRELWIPTLEQSLVIFDLIGKKVIHKIALEGVVLSPLWPFWGEGSSVAFLTSAGIVYRIDVGTRIVLDHLRLGGVPNCFETFKSKIFTERNVFEEVGGVRWGFAGEWSEKYFFPSLGKVIDDFDEWVSLDRSFLSAFYHNGEYFLLAPGEIDEGYYRTLNVDILRMNTLEKVGSVLLSEGFLGRQAFLVQLDEDTDPVFKIVREDEGQKGCWKLKRTWVEKVDGDLE